VDRPGNVVRRALYRAEVRPATNVARAIGHTGEALTDAEVVGFMWHQFEDLGNVSHNSLDTSVLTPGQTLRIQQFLEAGRFRLR
jgi:hypothetical protein